MAFLAGETLTAARLNDELGLTWTEYTPTWTTSGTQPSIGTGFLKGEWTQVGGLVRVRISLRFGSTTTGGTNGWSFGLPVTADYDADYAGLPIWSGSTVMRDVSASAWYTAQSFVESGGSGSGVLRDAGQISNTLPFAWANGDLLTFNLDYKAA